MKTVLPDVIVLDVSLPAGDGFMVADRLQKLITAAATPIIFVTASEKPGMRERAMNLGAVEIDDFGAGYSSLGYRRSPVIAELDTTLRQQGLAALDRFGDVSPQFRQFTGPLPYSGMRRRIDHLKLDDAADELVNGALPQASAT